MTYEDGEGGEGEVFSEGCDVILCGFYVMICFKEKKKKKKKKKKVK